MGFFGSLKKQRRLNRIAKGLSSSPLAEEKSIRANRGSPRAHAVLDLLNLCLSDPILSQVVHKYGASWDDLGEILVALMQNGAAQWVGGHFVPASALGYGQSLEFLLSEGVELPWSRKCVLLIEYFERNDSGPVPLEARGLANPNDPLHAIWEIENR